MLSNALRTGRNAKLVTALTVCGRLAVRAWFIRWRVAICWVGACRVAA